MVVLAHSKHTNSNPVGGTMSQPKYCPYCDDPAEADYHTSRLEVSAEPQNPLPSRNEVKYGVEYSKDNIEYWDDEKTAREVHSDEPGSKLVRLTVITEYLS